MAETKAVRYKTKFLEKKPIMILKKNVMEIIRENTTSYLNILEVCPAIL